MYNRAAIFFGNTLKGSANNNNNNRYHGCSSRSTMFSQRETSTFLLNSRANTFPSPRDFSSTNFAKKLKTPNFLYCTNLNSGAAKAKVFIQKRDFAGESRDLYSILGVAKDATEKDIKSAFRKLAMEYHPDRNPGDEAKANKFKEISAAYEILSDPEKRKNYDLYGDQVNGDYSGGGGMDIEELLKQFGFNMGKNPFSGFGFNPFTGGRDTGDLDVQFQQTITFMESIKGVRKEITYPVKQQCSECKGVGGFDVKKCTNCKGRGIEVISQGFMQIQTECSACKGEGQYCTKKCKTCNGRGNTPSNKTVTIDIPKGIEHGAKIRVSGQGSTDGRDKGDLYILVNVKAHEYFTRVKKDIHLEVPITITQAALGGTISVPTLAGFTEITVRPGTHHGDTEVLRGKGIQTGGISGNQVIKYKIVVPRNVTDKQRQLLEELAALEKPPNAWK